MCSAARRFAWALALIPLSPGPGVAGMLPENSPPVYELGKEATFQRGCFEPCLCPIMETARVRGRFVLVPTGDDGLFRTFGIHGVAWTVERPYAEAIRITGSGTYRVGGEFGVTHRMTLDLAVGGDPVERFDSGLVAGGGEFPAIDIVVSINGQFCFDTAIAVRARPRLDLDVSGSGLSWEGDPRAARYDVVSGDVGELARSGGDFAAATAACLADGTDGTALALGAEPPPGSAHWFLVAVSGPSPAGTWDEDGAGQVVSRVPGIEAAPASCR